MPEVKKSVRRQT